MIQSILCRCWNSAARSRHRHRRLVNSSSYAKVDKLPILSLPLQYLRAMDKTQFDASTHQRLDVQYDPNDGKPLPSTKTKPTTITAAAATTTTISECHLDPASNAYRIVWQDGLISEFSHDWVQKELSRWRPGGGGERTVPIRFWKNLTDQRVRDSEMSLSFRDAVMSNEGARSALKSLYQFGIVLVTDTPTNDGGAGIAALAATLGGGSIKEGNPTSLVPLYRKNPTTSLTMLPDGTDGPLRTLYGGVWSTASSGQAEGTSTADSAYGQEALPLHTDMTYHQNPPGLQIFTMAQPAARGGESVFGDGFAIAERLRVTNPEAFATLSHTIRRYHSIDDATGWYLEAHGPVISVRDNQVAGIRHNDLDRLPDLPPANSTPEEVDEFYDKLERAHQAWDELIAMDEYRLVMPLQAGETMVVANFVREALLCTAVVPVFARQ